MTIPAFIIGPRPSDGVPGIYVAPPGVDANTATAAQLMLSVNTFVDQIIMRGIWSSPWSAITLGLTSYTPIVLVTNIASNPSWASPGYFRPYPNFYGGANVTVSASSSSMSIAGAAGNVGYVIFNRAAP